MPASRRTPWLVCYDITDPSRLRRVHRTISRQAIAFQYSVFLAWGTRSRIEGILAGLETDIDPRRDDVRAYPLLTSARPVVYGRGYLPDGVIIGGAAGPFFHMEGVPATIRLHGCRREPAAVNFRCGASTYERPRKPLKQGRKTT